MLTNKLEDATAIRKKVFFSTDRRKHKTEMNIIPFQCNAMQCNVISVSSVGFNAFYKIRG